MKSKLSQCAFFFFLILLITALILLASVPPISRDALIHHLQLPKLYLQHGGIYEIPELTFSYYPMNLEMLYMAALSLGNDILPKYIHMAFGFATAWLLYGHLKKRLSSSYASLGGIFFLSIPIIVHLSITVYVDLGLVFFSLASLLLLFRWLEKGYQTRHIILSGICCGLALGTKYNGLLVLFLLTLFIPVLRLHSTKQKEDLSFPAIRAASLFFCTALLLASPWLVRNWTWTGNPVFPLYDGFFNPSSDGQPGKTAHIIQGVFATRHALYGENIWQLVLLPIRIFFEGQDGNPQYFDGRLNPFLLLLPLFAFYNHSATTRQIRIEKNTILFFCILYFLFAFHTNALRVRYLVPIVPGLVILSMYGLNNIVVFTKTLTSNKLLQSLFWIFPVGLMLLLNCAYIHKQFFSVKPFSFLSEQLTRDEYLIKYRGEYEVMRYANINLSDSDKILCVFLGWRGYYLDINHVFDQQDNPRWLFAWLKEEHMSSFSILQHLRERKITHLLIRTDLFKQWLRQDIPSKNYPIVNDLFKHSFSPLKSHSSYVLYRIDS